MLIFFTHWLFMSLFISKFSTEDYEIFYISKKKIIKRMHSETLAC